MTQELTQLHYITSDELRLILHYRLMSEACQMAIFVVAESQSNHYTREGDNGGNVVPFRPAQTA